MSLDLPDWTSAPVALFQSQVRDTTTATEAGSSRPVLTVPAGKSAVVTQLTIAAITTDLYAIRDRIIGQLYRLSDGLVIADIGISPLEPVATRDIPASAAVVAAGDAVWIQLTTAQGGGTTDVAFVLSYYLTS